MNLCCDVLKALAGKTLSAAESCTGGMIGEMLTAIPGSSAVYGYGFITYSNEAKMSLLGVSSETLERHTSVSEQTAIEMARGARKTLKTDIAVSVTGEAGPTPDPSTGCDVGTVFVGLSAENTEYATRVYISRHRDREYIRKVASSRAMREILKFLSKNG